MYALRNNNTLPNFILNEINKDDRSIHKAYQKRLPSSIDKDYYYMLRNTGITEPIIVKYGFMDESRSDENKSNNNYERYAEGVVKAISEYIGITYNAPFSSNNYIVKSGDSLWSIAKKFNTTVEELKNINNLNSNLISVNQILKIPQKIEINPDNYITYIVKSGDNLYALAHNYGLEVEELMNFNNLNTNILNVGQILKIPISKNSTYIVKNGDSIYKIAEQFNTTIDSLKEKNNLISNLITVGQILKI